MRVLGAILAGGRSTRFGSDKALAEIGGRTLLEYAVTALEQQCEKTIVVGRQTKLAPWIEDWPVAGSGPLGGLAAAVNHALANGFDLVLSSGVDCFGLPPDLAARLSPAPAFVASQPVIGLWPVRYAGVLEEVLFGNDGLSVRALADRIDARAVGLDRTPANINTLDDLRRAEKTYGL